MPINATRFEFLDKQTNVAVSSFTGKIDSGILNSVFNEAIPTSDQLQDIIDSVNQKSGELLSQFEDIKAQAEAGVGELSGKLNELKAEAEGVISDAVDTLKSTAGEVYDDAKEMLGDIVPSGLNDVARVTKGLVSKINDLASLPSASIDMFTKNIGGSSTMAQSLKNIMASCSKQGLGYGIPGRPYSPSISCGGNSFKLGSDSGYGNYSGYGSSSCNASNYGDLLNKLTNGDYGSSFNDYNKALQTLMSLSGYGYNLGMCGVFNALSSNLNLDKFGLSKAAGGLMGIFAAGGKTNAFLDMAASTSGLFPGKYNPGILSSFTSGYQIPSGVGGNGYRTLAERSYGAIDSVNGSWSSNDRPGCLTLGNAIKPISYNSSMAGLDTAGGLSIADSLSSVMKSKVSDHSFSSSNLDSVFTTDDDSFVTAALSW